MLQFFFQNTLLANGLDSSLLPKIITQAENLRLENDPVWLRLLEYNSKGESAILSEDFFLSPDGSVSANAELKATLSGFFTPIQGDPNKHIRCRYPARYEWLKSRIPSLDQALPKILCSRLETWAKFDDLESVSLIMVSGYFGNPASTFGHILIKLNNSTFTDSGDLLDRGINFGALVPENEPALIYTLKGLFGGYVAGFSDKRFYTQDLVYSEIQSRDMWEYELNLSKEQNRLLIMHLWELVGRKYPYFFLKENCGFRIAELMELVTDESLIEDPLWYLPVSVFHSINELNQSKLPGLIKQVQFLPSSQRNLYQRFRELTKSEASAVNHLIEKPSKIDTDFLEKRFSNQQRVRISNVLLDYYKYKISGDQKSELDVLKERKNRVIAHRLQLPAETGIKDSNSFTLPNPSNGTRPGMISIGLGTNHLHGYQAQLRVAAVHFDIIGNNTGGLENAELNVLDFEIGYQTNGDWHLNHLDFISIQKLGLNRIDLTGESNFSWRIKAGLKRENLSCYSCTNVQVSAGIGKASAIGGDLIGYAMLDGQLSFTQNYLSVSPTLGMIHTMGTSWKSLLEIGLRNELKKSQRETQVKFESRYSLTKSDQLRFSYEYHQESELKLSFFHYL